jgi:hypothetical protein
MRIKRKILIPIFALAILAMLAAADIPPPPANQNFGIYDTMLMNPADSTGQTPIYNQTMCRGCHTSSGTLINGSLITSGGVDTRHHNLVMNSSTNPYTSTPFQCTDCHPTIPGTGNGILLDHNCLDCHNATTFWGDNAYGAKVGNFARPHHNTTHAQQRNCKFCHGASVDDYNDGHYVPTYDESSITPSAMFKAWNGTSGRVWGGCLACHAQDTTKTVPLFFTQVQCGLYTNGSQIVCPVNGKYLPNQPNFVDLPLTDNNVHHAEILGTTIIPGSNDSQGAECLWCHSTSGSVVNVLDVRGCETCHSVRAIHNTQFDYANTSNFIGYGHIGSNNPNDVANYSWDCKGCHAWYDAGDTNPFAGAIVPDVQLATPTVFNANTPTVITLTGTNFMQTSDTTIVNIDDSTNITPSSISNSQITATVNLPAGNHYIKVVVTDPVENVPKPSDIKPLTVLNKVAINSATLSISRSGVTLVIYGSGFGSSKPNSGMYVSVSHAGHQIPSSSVTKWSDTQISAKFPSGSIASRDIATVVAANSGEASAAIN